MRTRTINPEFWIDEKIIELSVEARLLFMGLWGHADREGRFEWRILKIKSAIFPADNFNIDKLLNLLLEKELILKYSINKKNYGYIANFKKFQHPHPHEVKSKIPPPPEESIKSIPNDNVITCNDNVITSNGDVITCNDNVSQCQSNVSNVSNVSNISNKNKIKDNYSCDFDKSLCPYQKILDLYHTLTNLPKVKILSEKRKGYLRARWKKFPNLNFWQDYFTKVSESLFLTGQVESKNGSPPFQADFEWLITESNFIKVVEGKYKNKEYKTYKPKTFEEIKRDNTIQAGLNVLDKIKRGELI